MEKVRCVFSLIRVSVFLHDRVHVLLVVWGRPVACAILMFIILGITGQMLHVFTDLILNLQRGWRSGLIRRWTNKTWHSQTSFLCGSTRAVKSGNS
jgi:hypothetical protein